MVTTSKHPSHPEHEHELGLTVYKGRYTCDGCLMDGYGERYRCKELCNYDLQKECMSMHKKQTLTPESFPDCTFEFMYRPPPGTPKCTVCSGNRYCGHCRACDVCGVTVKGFIYHCAEENLDVHPLCAMLKSKIKVDGVEFRLRKGAVSKCNWCNKRQLKGSVKNIPGFCYVSDCKQYSFHVYCLMEMGIQYGDATAYDHYDDNINGSSCGELAVRELSLQKMPRRSGGTTKFIKVVKLFLKIVLSLLFGDPTAILASVVVQLLS